DAVAAVGVHPTELGEPAVVGAGAGPLQRTIAALWREPDAGAEGRRVHLRDPVRKEDLAGDAVRVHHLGPRVGIPCTGQQPLATGTPLLVDLLHEEEL